MCMFMQIYVVDSLDRERIGKAKQEFQVISPKTYKLTHTHTHNMLFQTDFELIYGLLADNHKRPVYAQQCHLGTCQQTRPGMCILICALLLPSE